MNIGVIFAGGVGTRMHSRDLPKQFLKIHDKPIIVHTIEHFENCKDIDSVVVVCVKEWIDHLNKLIDSYHLKKIKAVVPGGESGQLSIYNGLVAAKEVAGEEKSVVLIHDGVRPLISSELLARNIECVKKFGSSITSGIVKETIVEIDDEGRHVAYYVVESDGTEKRIPAFDSKGRRTAWLVYASDKRLNSVRGYSPLGAIVQKIRKIGQYAHSEIIAASG